MFRSGAQEFDLGRRGKRKLLPRRSRAMAKFMKLRRTGECCYQPDTAAEKSRSVKELARAAASVTPPAETMVVASATPAETPSEKQSDVAGASAQLEYDKRSTRESAKKERRIAEDASWREEAKEQRPVVGRIVTALTPKPQMTPESQSTQAWKVGAVGERRVAEVLSEAEGIRVMHDRLVPGSRANIDHLAIGAIGPNSSRACTGKPTSCGQRWARSSPMSRCGESCALLDVSGVGACGKSVWRV